MASYFSPETIASLSQGHDEIAAQFRGLQERYILREFANDRAREHASHGFCRRLSMLVRAIDQVYAILPPEREDIPDREEVMDATIAIQSFVFNVFGCLDNLAWIWVHEKNVRKEDGNELSPRAVGLGKNHARVLNTFSDGFRTYLESRQAWLDHLKEFRDALAHRIPLYIPPHIVPPDNADEYQRLEQALWRGDKEDYDRLRGEQRKLVLFRPWMTHSAYENAPVVVFHERLLADYVA